MADGAGHAIAFRLAPGQAHELPHAVPLLDCLPDVPKWVVADRGYTSHAFRRHIWDMGSRPAIPPLRHEAPVACPDWIYNNRNKVERLWAPEGMACRRNPIRENRRQLPRRPLPRSGSRLAQVLKGPSRVQVAFRFRFVRIVPRKRGSSRHKEQAIKPVDGRSDEGQVNLTSGGHPACL